MKNQKLKFPFAAITVLCWFLFTVYSVILMTVKYLDMGIQLDFIFEVHGLSWITAVVSLLLLTLVLFSRTRTVLLPFAILIQLSTLADYVYSFLIKSNIPELLKYYSKDFVYGHTTYAVSFAVITLFAFIFSIVCLSGRNKVLSVVFFIIYMILFLFYILCNITCAIVLEYSVGSFIEMCLRLLSFLFLGIWIAFPYKRNYQEQNRYGETQQYDRSAYQNPGYRGPHNEQNQQYRQPYQYPRQDSRQSEQSAAYNYPAGQTSFSQPKNYDNPNTCPSCGAPLNEDDIFCGNCGTKCK